MKEAASQERAFPFPFLEFGTFGCCAVQPIDTSNPLTLSSD
jgi:hypothetical protein